MSIAGGTPSHFIIWNSCGNDWGNKGLAYSSYDYARNAFDYAYGIVN